MDNNKVARVVFKHADQMNEVIIGEIAEVTCRRIRVVELRTGEDAIIPRRDIVDVQYIEEVDAETLSIEEFSANALI